jgi:histidine triad (HIT) family protein
MEIQNISAQQAQTIQERIKNMSPEEPKEFQKQQCVFCHIVSGKVPSKKIYEDDTVLAILDINPANPGHILLLPKEHYVIMPQIPEDVISNIFMVAKALSNTILKALGVKGTNIFIANGIAAGQKAQHFMIHIIPRNENDDLSLTIQKRNISKYELEKIRDILLPKINGIFGILSNGEELKKPRVVEAEFEEKKVTKPKIQRKKKSTKNKQKKQVKKNLEKNEGINLDDIARILQ